MKTFLKFLCICLTVGLLVWFGTVLADREQLNDGVIRLHVVAASDHEEDQQLKLQVRDAIVSQLQPVMEQLPTAEEAKQYLLGHLQQLEEAANRVLSDAGCEDTAVVTFCEEAFDIRHYETFSLPSGVYDALRITIGEGEGRNWWCVVFPTLCAGATAEEFTDISAGSGFDTGLTGALQQQNGYKVRFFFLDLLGNIQNFFHRK